MKYKKGKDNIVTDALSHKMILLAKLEINVLGLDEITDFYASEPTFGPILPSAHVTKVLMISICTRVSYLKLTNFVSPSRRFVGCF